MRVFCNVSPPERVDQGVPELVEQDISDPSRIVFPTSPGQMVCGIHAHQTDSPDRCIVRPGEVADLPGILLFLLLLVEKILEGGRLEVADSRSGIRLGGMMQVQVSPVDLDGLLEFLQLPAHGSERLEQSL